MTTTLTPGANAPLTATSLTVEVIMPQGADIDVSALQLYADGKVRGDGDMCFYNQRSVSGGALSMNAPQPGRAVFSIDTSRLPSDIEKIVITGTLDGAGKTFGKLSDLHISIPGMADLVIPTAGRAEAALILAEVYKRNGQWKIRNVGQGFNGGLKALAEHFGVDIADTVPTPAYPPQGARPSPSPGLIDTARPPKVSKAPSQGAAPINLSKVSLTKQDKTISLEKNDGKFGKIRVNLNWNQKPKKSGMLGLGSSAIDLDLGAFIEDIHGNITAVQALGNGFGDYGYFPYVKLLGDDRTGAVTDGEWIEINGEMWPEIHRILIFAFIYEGAINWAETDGVVRIMAPGQPEVEVRMNEFAANEGMCGVALLENHSGKLKISREVTFHKGHRYMDDHYGWGMNWRAGSK
jgi:tellurite resistance protein TerA